MFKGFQEGFILINNDLETIFNNGLDSNCNYNIKLALSDIHNLMTMYKNHEKTISLSMLKNDLGNRIIFVLFNLTTLFPEKTEQGEFNRKFPDSKATYSMVLDVKKVRLLLKKIEYFLSWVDEIKL